MIAIHMQILSKMRLLQTIVFSALAVAISTSKLDTVGQNLRDDSLSFSFSETMEIIGEAKPQNATDDKINFGDIHEDARSSILLEKTNSSKSIDDSKLAAFTKSAFQQDNTPAPRALPPQKPNLKSTARATFNAIFADITNILRLIDNAMPVSADISQVFYASIILLQKSYMRKYIGADSTEWSSYPEFEAFQQKTRRLSQIVKSMRDAVHRKKMSENKKPMDPEYESFRRRLGKLENDVRVVEEITMWEDVIDESKLEYLRGIVADVKRNFQSFQRFDIPFWIDEPGFDAVDQSLVIIATKIEDMEKFLRVNRKWEKEGDEEIHHRFEKYKDEVVRVDDLARYYVNHFHENPNANDEMKRIMAKMLIRVATWFEKIKETNTSEWTSEPEFYIVHLLKERIARSIETLEDTLND